MSTTITVDDTRYTIPTDAAGNPVDRFTLPDGRIVRVTARSETVPAQVARFEVEPAAPMAVALATGAEVE